MKWISFFIFILLIISSFYRSHINSSWQMVGGCDDSLMLQIHQTQSLIDRDIGLFFIGLSLFLFWPCPCKKIEPIEKVNNRPIGIMILGYVTIIFAAGYFLLFAFSNFGEYWSEMIVLVGIILSSIGLLALNKFARIFFILINYVLLFTAYKSSSDVAFRFMTTGNNTYMLGAILFFVVSTFLPVCMAIVSIFYLTKPNIKYYFMSDNKKK